ncbi:hypothetical protein ACT405_17830 [Acinetobacter baumannii]
MKKKELVEKVTGWILAVTLYGTAVFYFVTKVLKITGDDLDAFVGLLGVGATLFGGYMAIYLFTDWRDQKQFEVEKEKLDNILKFLGGIHTSLILLNSDINYLNKTENQFTYYPKILERRNPNIQDELFNMFSEIKVYSILANNEDLIKLYNNFEKTCFALFGLNEIYIKNEYKKYLDCIYENHMEDESNIAGYEKNYTLETKIPLKEYIIMLKVKLEYKLPRSVIDTNGNVILNESKTYLEYIKQARKEVDEMMMYCAEKIKPN